MLGLLDMNDMQKLLDEVIRERDELIAEVQRLKEELGNANEYGDCEHNYADCLKLEVKQARQERDEAREAARFYRDLYVSQVERTYPEEYTLPWEAEK